MNAPTPAPKLSTSANPFRYPTIAAAALRVEHDLSLDKVEARHRASDLRSFHKRAGLLPDTPFDPKAMAKVMASTTAAGAKVSKGRWINICGSVKWALHHLNLTKLPIRSQCALLVSWMPLRDAIKGDVAVYTALTRSLRFFSANAIGPADVRPEHFIAFHEALRNSPVPKPDLVYRQACKYWNLARAKYGCWPDVAVDIPSFSDTYTLPIEAFPLLQPQVEAYLAFARGDDKPGRSKLLRKRLGKGRRRKPNAKSDEKVRYLLRQAASCLVERGRDAASITLETLADPEILVEGLEFLVDRGRARWAAEHPDVPLDEEVIGRDSQSHLIACAVSTMARSYLKVPPETLEVLRDLRLNMTPIRDAGAQILKDLEPLLDEERLKAFYREPDRIVAEAEALDKPDAAAARRVMYALWWRFETRFPLRLDDSLNLMLGENITWTGPIESASFGLHMTRTAKGGKAVHVIVPDAVARFLRLWICKYRPLLCGAQSSPYLFPNDVGGRREGSNFSESLGKFMLDRIGFSIHRHSFRHLATYVYLKACPGDLAGASTLLGHSTIITTATYYDVLRKLTVWANFDKYLLQIEEE